MQPTHDNRIADLIGDLTALSTVLGDLHRTGEITEETRTECECFEHDLLFDCLTNNLRDGWRLSSAAGFLAPTSSPPTDVERIAAAPFAALLTAADNLFVAAGAETVAEVRDALACTVEALAGLIACLLAGRVTLPSLLDGDELDAAEAEADTLPGPSAEAVLMRSLDGLAASDPLALAIMRGLIAVQAEALAVAGDA